MAAMTDVKLPIRPIVMAAFHSLAEHFPALLRLFWFPAVAMVATEITSRLVSTRQLDPIEIPWDAAVLGGIAVVMTLATVAVVPAATSWHRLVLFGHQQEEARYRLTARELRYALYLLIYCAIVIAAAIPCGFAVFWGALGLVALGLPIGFADVESLLAGAVAAGMAVALFATVRLFLLFPGIAIGRRIGLKQAGQASRGNQMRLFIASIIPMAPVSLIRLLTETPADAGVPAILAASVTATVLLIPFLAVSVSVLSLSYRALCPPQPGAVAQAA